jgi:hypothetical protein
MSVADDCALLCLFSATRHGTKDRVLCFAVGRCAGTLDSASLPKARCTSELRDLGYAGLRDPLAPLRAGSPAQLRCPPGQRAPLPHPPPTRHNATAQHLRQFLPPRSATLPATPTATAPQRRVWHTYLGNGRSVATWNTRRRRAVIGALHRPHCRVLPITALIQSVTEAAAPSTL